MNISGIALALDAVTVLLIAIPVLVGIKKGLKNRVLKIISFIASAAMATAAASAAAEPIYNKYLHRKVLNECNAVTQKYDPINKTSDILQNYGIDVSDEDIRSALSSADSLPDSVDSLVNEYGAVYGLGENEMSSLTNEVTNKLEGQVPTQVKEILPDALKSLSNTGFTSGQIYDTIRECSSSPEQGAEYIESRYAAPLFTSLLKLIIFAVALPLISLVLRLIFYLFGFSFKDNAETVTDSVLGAIIGLITGTVYVTALVIIVSFCEQTSEGLFSVSQTDSVIFKAIYDFLY